MLRRSSLLPALLVLVLLGWLLETGRARGSEGATAVPVQLGYTFSPRQADYLGMPRRDTLAAALTLDVSLVRLGAYWDELEPQSGRYDFSSLDWQMDQAAASGRGVVLTVGMKAPRWPEYFLPTWLKGHVPHQDGLIVSDLPEVRAAALRFVRTVATHYRDHPALRYWQVENEPLDPSGPLHWSIRPEFLAGEIATLRAADEQRHQVVLNMFAHLYPLAPVLPWSRGDDQRAATLLELGDILGLDVYPSVSLRLLGFNLYFDFTGWDWTAAVQRLGDQARRRDKPAWIVEAQAEPWEPSAIVATRPGQARSLGPGQAERILARLRDGGFDTILAWGVEHWYMRRETQNDASWWDAGQLFLNSAPPAVQLTDRGGAGA